MDKKALLSLLAPEIKKVETAMQAEFTRINSPLLADVITHGIFNGGKRIRPILTLLTARLVAYTRMPKDIGSEEQLTPPDQLYRLAMVFEFLHGASLLHDDVIDQATSRRGKETAHKKWGHEAAILAGDYLHTLAMTIAGTVGDSHILAMIGTATAAMIDAEFLQAESVSKQDIAEESYFAVLRGKTSALIGAACETGAFFAQGDNNQCQALRTFGDALGLAFQMIDDLLDYQGDPVKTGKMVGNDFREGKMTLPLIHTLENGSNNTKEIITTLLQSDAQARLKAIDQVIDLIADSNGFNYTRQGAETIIAAAIEALVIFPDCQAKATLINIAHYVLERDK